MTTHSNPRDQSEIPDYALTAWGLRENKNKPDSKSLSIDKIITVATSIADTDGLDGLTIRKLSKQLGFTTMAVYRHVASRDELLLLMVNTAFGLPPTTLKTAPTWQQSYRAWGNSLFKKYRTYPWLLAAPVGLPTTPNNMLWLEYILAGTTRTQLSLQQRLDCALLIDGHARNFAYIAKHNSPNSPHASITWLPPLVDDATYPLFSQVLKQGLLEDSSEDPDFAFGLDRIIEGIEPLVTV